MQPFELVVPSASLAAPGAAPGARGEDRESGARSSGGADSDGTGFDAFVATPAARAAGGDASSANGAKGSRGERGSAEEGERGGSGEGGSGYGEVKPGVFASVSGFVSRTGAGVGRSNSGRQFVFLNRRPVDMPKVRAAPASPWPPPAAIPRATCGSHALRLTPTPVVSPSPAVPRGCRGVAAV